MDIATSSALALYNYSTTLKRSGSGASTNQNAAVLQALASAYSGYSTSQSSLGTDSLGALAGSSVLAPLMSGVYAASAANGNASFSASDPSTFFSSAGGLDSSTASSLLFGFGSSGLDGFSSAAMNPNLALALAAYSNHQNGVPTTLTSAANAVRSSADPTSAAYVQQVLKSAQASAFSSTLSLLG
jgi:hypothetical protein